MPNLLWSHAAGLLGFTLAVLATLNMLAERRTPQSALAWLIVMFAFPWVGVPLYLTFGGRKIRALMATKGELALAESAQPSEKLYGVECTLRALSMPPASSGNHFYLHEDGASAFTALLSVLDSSTRSIDYATFIWVTTRLGVSYYNIWKTRREVA